MAADDSASSGGALLSALLEVLSDGQFHSGEHIAAQLGTSRANIWRYVKQAEKEGLNIFAVRGKGYRWRHPTELLDAKRILAYCEQRRLLPTPEVFWSVGSTSDFVRENPTDRSSRVRDSLMGSAIKRICLAERQTAGRGRRGRQWQSPPACNLYMSLLIQDDFSPHPIAAASLVVAIAVCEALDSLGFDAPKAKWPNDIRFNGRKVAGVLCELTGEISGDQKLIVGVGVNVAMPAEVGRHIEQPWVNLAELRNEPISRNQLASRIIDAVHTRFAEFKLGGFEQMMSAWRRFDEIVGKAVTLQAGSSTISGTAKGVDPDGALILETDVGEQRFYGGEVSLRVSG